MKPDDENDKTRHRAGAAAGTVEIINRHGEAGAEYLKAYRGRDNATGQVYKKSLKNIATYKLNPEYVEQNLKQQAGYSAEVAKVAKDNAENIIKSRPERVMRSDDVAGYGTNHTVYDTLVLVDGKVIDGAQMKFVSNPEDLVKKIARGRGGGKIDLSRYLDAHLDLPTEQVEGLKKHCTDQATKLRGQAVRMEQAGKNELAEQYRQDADNYEKVKGNIRDSGLTREEAMRYRQNPKWEIAKDIGKVSHKAALQGAGISAAIGGVVCGFQNALACYKGEKNFTDAALDTAKSAGKAAATGYGATFVGTALTTAMSQAEKTALRSLAKTSLPTMALSMCLEAGALIRDYARGHIGGVEFMEKMGDRGAGMLTSGFMAGLGQLAIPIPVVGAVVGGMIGYTLSSMFYHEALSAFKEAEKARADYLAIKARCEEAQAAMLAYREEAEKSFRQYFSQMQNGIATCFERMDQAIGAGQIDDFMRAANSLADTFGAKLQFSSFEEFDDFLDFGQTLLL